MTTSIRRPSFTWGGYFTGFALGGFFDGILLHQILQWHHLLSTVEGAGFRDLRFQVLADGYFHALMYVIAAIGLWLLWKGRAALTSYRQGRILVGNLLIGFGFWHVLDSVMSHWGCGNDSFLEQPYDIMYAFLSATPPLTCLSGTVPPQMWYISGGVGGCNCLKTPPLMLLRR